MSSAPESPVARICREHGRDPARLLDVERAVLAATGQLSSAVLREIAAELSLAPAVAYEVASFYSFLGVRPRGRIVIRLSDDVPDRMAGYDEVRDAFAEALGVHLGGTTPDGAFTLLRTACIGLSDQGPAALVNEVPVTRLTPERARGIVHALREHGDPRRLVTECGDGMNAHPLVKSMVANQLRLPGPILFSPEHRGHGLGKALGISPMEVIREVKASRLRGRGGAGFPCGMKWEFTRAADGGPKVVVANADEGEPGTFKDRVLLTERANRLFAGMAIAGYAIGAAEGILYLRAEYEYLVPWLEHVLEQRRGDGLLGPSIFGKKGFDFDVRIRLGAGAYVCGEESALLESAEGRRGDPRTRPPFPAQRGFEGRPTCVNNVETLCSVSRIMAEGAASFREHGTTESAGTKLLSISGDCEAPGVYEVPLGLPLRDVLGLCGGGSANAVQVGGASGRLVPPAEYDRTIAFDDLSTGGSIMVFGPGRDLLEIAEAFLEFFAEESCGTCVPCRAGNEILLAGVRRIRAGRGEPEDLTTFEELGRIMKSASRCGLGQSSSNPVLTSMAAFPDLWREQVKADPDGYRRSFDQGGALAGAKREGGGQ